MATRRSGLGKGLDALLSNQHATDGQEAGGPLWVPVTHLSPNRLQPREDFDRGLEGLIRSVRRHGIMQPILVTALPDGRYEILAGERRWRAAQAAGMKKVPVIVREGAEEERERLELALIENIQREDLDPIERARACRRLLDDFQLTQEQVAESLGMQRSTVGNLVRLLELPEEFQAAVSRGTISAGHARALLRLGEPSRQREMYKRMVDEDWSVRKTEAVIAAAVAGKMPPAHRARPRQPAWIADLQNRLTKAVGLKAEIRLRRQGGGRVILHFRDLDELDRYTRTLPLQDEVGDLLGD